MATLDLLFFFLNFTNIFIFKRMPNSLLFSIWFRSWNKTEYDDVVDFFIDYHPTEKSDVVS